MSLDLPVIETPYKDASPTFDVSQFLANGCEPFSQGSVMATIERNHVFWDCRITTTNAVNHENRRIFDGLPVELRPPVGAIRSATRSSSLLVLAWHINGWVFISDATDTIRPGVIAFEARTIRRPL